MEREIMTRIFVPQPIPEVAAAELDKLGEVTTYPHVDRMIPESELLEAVRDKHILFGIGEIPFNEQSVRRGERVAVCLRHAWVSEVH